MRPLYQTAEFCAACHKAAIPRTLDDYKWLRAISLYDEWQAASFTKQSPLPFYRKDSVSTCQTCHMVREPLPRTPSIPAPRTASSFRIAGSVATPSCRSTTSTPSRPKNSWPSSRMAPTAKVFSTSTSSPWKKKSAAATAEDQVLVAPLGLTSFSLAPGETLVADVVIQNKGIGHSFIPEQRDFYEAWVDFTVKDGSGKVPRRERLHPARRHPRPRRPLLHQPPHQQQRRAERPAPDLAQPRPGLQQHHPVRPLAAGPLPLPLAQRTSPARSPSPPPFAIAASTSTSSTTPWTRKPPSTIPCRSSTWRPRPGPSRSAKTLPSAARSQRKQGMDALE